MLLNYKQNQMSFSAHVTFTASVLFVNEKNLILNLKSSKSNENVKYSWISSCLKTLGKRWKSLLDTKAGRKSLKLNPNKSVQALCVKTVYQFRRNELGIWC